jgi:hypothetical protein
MNTNKPAPEGTGLPLRPEDSTVPQAGMTDADILEMVEPVYEWAVWASDLGMVDFDTFAELARVIRELRDRAEAAA